MRWREPRRSQAIAAAWLAATFALSALADPRALAAALVGALVLFRRGARRHIARSLRAVLPATLLVTLSALAWGRLAGAPARGADLAALNLRAVLLSFLALAVLARVNLFHALARFPALSRVLAVALGQIHALRLLASESALGLRSRLARKPRARDVVRGAGALTGTLFTLTSRNAREVADALRARGF